MAGGPGWPHSARLLVHSGDFKLFCWYFTQLLNGRQRAWQRRSQTPKGRSQHLSTCCSWSYGCLTCNAPHRRQQRSFRSGCDVFHIWERMCSEIPLSRDTPTAEGKLEARTSERTGGYNVLRPRGQGDHPTCAGTSDARRQDAGSSARGTGAHGQPGGPRPWW